MTTQKKIEVNLADLTYIDEEKDLASSLEDEFRYWLEDEVAPATVEDEDMRAEYLAFLTKGGYDIPA